MKFTFKCQPEIDERENDSTVTLEVNSVFLPDILQEFTHFLRGVGFTVDEIVHIREDEDDCCGSCHNIQDDEEE